MGVNRLPPDVRGQELIVWPMDIISHILFSWGVEKKRNQLKPGTTIPNHLQRTKKYITSIMDEESSDHMDEVGIPMLVLGYNQVI